MRNFSEIKSTSKEQLLDNWKLPVLFTFLTLVLYGISIYFDDDISNFGIAVTLTISILVGILSIFLTNILLNIAKYNEVKSIKIPLKKFLRIIGASIVVFIPMFVLIFLIVLGATFGLVGITDSFMPILIIIISIYAFCFIAGLYLSFVNYLILDDNKIFKSIKYSFLYMKGNLLKTIWLCITFIPWMLLTVITLGLGLLYAGPYLQLVYINYYLELKNEFNTKNE
ncbi:DUF975 family protein [Romboutsia lituseburensis]|uniref:DUF975 family protein n=1 Tax=Romboutsia lituseburensis TaxID=1537 RepID=UPI00215AE09D|nr:DUF975 family protein [Romboutsia lituseburensis]MCR8745534.1 DUF975 family protein [Romboutsia lituseburensis]